MNGIKIATIYLACVALSWNVFVAIDESSLVSACVAGLMLGVIITTYSIRRES